AVAEAEGHRAYGLVEAEGLEVLRTFVGHGVHAQRFQASPQRIDGPAAGLAGDGLREGPVAPFGACQRVTSLRTRHVQRAHGVALDVQELAVAEGERLFFGWANARASH